MKFPVLISVDVVAPYILLLKYEDGEKGEVDLSAMKGKGVFIWWNEKGNFEKVKLEEDRHVLKWTDDIEIDTDALYLKMLGLTFEQWKSRQTHATIS